MNKEQKLLKLARIRQSKVYEGYKSIADKVYANGVYECDYVSPYSKSAHNVDADVFVILKDWSSHKGLKGDVGKDSANLGYSSTVKTNINLIKYLKTYLGLELKDTYATNLFPYIKSGEMRGDIPPKDVKRAAQEFTLPMIDIIKPKIAIALGLEVFNGLRQGLKLKKVYNKAEAVKNTFDYGDTKIFFQAHPSSSTTNVFIKENWGKMKRYLDG